MSVYVCLLLVMIYKKIHRDSIIRKELERGVFDVV